ncbi:ATP-binding cassette domain-containing protein [Blastopirellula marina]|uniref:ABC transporter domain-containing protein n=1 Tax=Blastopirellula marina TaxID=124 RepID=A0A2S8G2A8_9BACT|nr:ATP-binding cassette domain-containing protein [Blastopirellula marina]PQO38579.1 hypothetical protein C5Y98_11065 [Blastopirellula marina]PTL45236.1 hypothetical protein C5Y97_11075 [Blastopirellula marina]
MRRNPFSTRFIRPGQIPFQFSAGHSANELWSAVASPGAQWAIVGPHGSGKSTLLEMLASGWQAHGLTEQRVRLTAARKRESIPWGTLDENSLLVIDGFEQLAWWRQRWVRYRCHQKRVRLLVTCHADCGVPILLRTEATWPLAYTLAGMLLACDATPYEDQLHAIWQEAPGNIRDFFFRLYHWCESCGIYQAEQANSIRQSLSI